MSPRVWTCVVGGVGGVCVCVVVVVVGCGGGVGGGCVCGGRGLVVWMGNG